mmetsp:Transcript_14439/g.26072  ORF Transcript_14439/g.26072 Transcript_14439/m.26072 type:complete len:138 (-) Transcript_14439:1187-1600(-)|eukprot:CAMPEP_0201602622 /NCGR_PEP_ID=MMETSP0492-20130828/3293_1 /ASSEMBLY_ACC=CAM_ASM_000837 /TAXON_ID=420259 /ORGANISM="Thalassiosira gravida, Strain GMp14c1" /LENGTH=137 /DNA_ID=CAMNT_0048066179 /DNA_START=65 /DNA_END=478 /DNA_ORIENTATION=-
MPSSSSTFSLILVALAIALSSAFAPTPSVEKTPSRTTVLHAKGDEDGFNIPNPFAELGEMFSSLDDVIDDFFNKRMGNGEVFYGKRKYKPSGNIETDYNGGGLSDWREIEAAREYREERAMMRELAKEQQMKAGSKD